MKKSHFLLSAVLVLAVLSIFLSCDILGGKRYTVTYDGNNATGGIIPMDSATYKDGATVTVLGPNVPTRIGYLFDSWNIAADGSGTAYMPNDTFIMGKANVLLYAQWTPHRTVTYLPNGATGGNPPVDSTIYTEGATVSILNPGTLARQDSLFLNWNTAADGSGTAYDPSDTFVMGTIGIGLYAQWWQSTVHFDVGASAPAIPDVHTTNLASFPAAAWDGHALEGWYEEAGFVTKVAFPLNLTTDRTILYAHWVDATIGLAYAPVTGGYAVSKGTSENIAGTITIPTHWLGDPVVAISGNGFMDHDLITGIVIPSSVTSIGAHAFDGCSQILTVELPAGLATLGEYAFANCSTLNSIIVPSLITVLGNGMFSSCSSLTNIDLPDTLTTINESALRDTGLVNIDIPESVTSIGAYAFRGCSMLATADLSDGLTTLGEYAFAYCSNLNNITIPSGITVLGNWMFYVCRGLTNIVLPAEMTMLNDRSLSGTGIGTISLPTSLQTIGYAAFWDCNNLTALDIPATVTYIDDWAFRDCDILATVHSRSSSPPLVRVVSNPMFHLSPVAHIYVPTGSVAAYEGATGWGDYDAQIEQEP